MPLHCWNCGAEQNVVTCKRCGSTDRLPNHKGCRPCHYKKVAARAKQRRAERAQPGLTAHETRVFNALQRDTFQDIRITNPIREYLNAFTAYLTATKEGDTRQARLKRAARHQALNALEDQR